MIPVSDLLKKFLPNPLIRKPIKGSSGTQYTKEEKLFAIISLY
jgi:hypothetical protein